MNKNKKITSWIALALLTCILTGCHIPFTGHTKDGPPHRDVDVSKIPNATPRDLPKSPYGNPKRYTVNGVTYHVLPTAKNYQAVGIASWYGKKFHGRLTSTRERYNMFAMTAASPVLPIPSFVRVTNLRNGRSIIVKVNDRGPFAPNRILDLSYAAAKKLGYLKTGTTRVRVTAINLDDDPNVNSTDEEDIDDLDDQDENTDIEKIATNKTTETESTESPRTFGPSPTYLQLGAFQDKQNAEKLKQLLQIHFPYPIHIQHHPGHGLFRVTIGPIDSAEASNRTIAQLKSLGYQAQVHRSEL